jgi:S1-C subfamily serine protease
LRDFEWRDGPDASPHRKIYTTVFWVVVLCLVLASGVAYHRAEVVADEAEQQRAIATFRPVRGAFTAMEVEKLAGRITPSMVDVETEIRNSGVGGAGTGIVLNPNGEVLTNNHVINGATTIEVVTKGNGQRYSAHVVGYDRWHDVALLQIENPKRLTGAVIGDSSKAILNEPVLGIGNAGGKGGKPVRAPGKITGFSRSISTNDELTGSSEQLQGLIQVAANIAPGDSGGPLVNEAGEVIGVNTAASINYKTNIPNGVGFAIPINQAMGIVDVIRAGKSTEEVHVGPTGIIGVAVTGPAVLPGGYTTRSNKPGATVTSVAFGSPGEEAGLQRGDVIVELDGKMVDSPTRLTSIVGQHGPGDKLTMVWTDAAGQRKSGTVTLAEGPPA